MRRRKQAEVNGRGIPFHIRNHIIIGLDNLAMGGVSLWGTQGYSPILFIGELKCVFIYRGSFNLKFEWASVYSFAIFKPIFVNPTIIFIKDTKDNGGRGVCRVY